MGYISQTHKVSVSKTGKVDFILKEDAVNMETIVVTGTRTPKLLKDVPIVTRVITADEIKKVDATHIGDLLQAELPGIEFLIPWTSKFLSICKDLVEMLYFSG